MTPPDLEPAEEEEAAAEEARAYDAELLERRDAALSHVVKFGDPVLRSKASPVGEFGAALSEEVGRMIAIMQGGMGVGLAATQLGVLRRLLVFQAGMDAQPQALVNPRIEWASDEEVLAEEGCLSLPRVSVDVDRPLFVRVAGHDERGEEIVIEASGLEARVLQHEIDHLDGVLILDRTSRDQRKGALRALREGGTYSPPTEDDEAEAAVDSCENANVPASSDVSGEPRRFGRFRRGAAA